MYTSLARYWGYTSLAAIVIIGTANLNISFAGGDPSIKDKKVYQNNFMVLRNFYNQLSELKLDKNERKFVDYFNFKKLKERENVLLVVPNDYYYVCYNYLLSKERVSKFNVFVSFDYLFGSI